MVTYSGGVQGGSRRCFETSGREILRRPNRTNHSKDAGKPVSQCLRYVLFIGPAHVLPVFLYQVVTFLLCSLFLFPRSAQRHNARPIGREKPEHWGTGTLEPRNAGTQTPWFIGTQKTLEQKEHMNAGTREHRYAGTQERWYTGSQEKRKLVRVFHSEMRTCGLSH